MIIAHDATVRITLDTSGIALKEVLGPKRVLFVGELSVKEIVDRELCALSKLEGLTNIPTHIQRINDHSFSYRFVEGQTLKSYAEQLPQSYFAQLQELLRACTQAQVYKINNHRNNILVLPNGEAGIIDFGEVLFPEDLGRYHLLFQRMIRPAHYLRIKHLENKYRK